MKTLISAHIVTHPDGKPMLPTLRSEAPAARYAAQELLAPCSWVDLFAKGYRVQEVGLGPMRSRSIWAASITVRRIVATCLALLVALRFTAMDAATPQVILSNIVTGLVLAFVTYRALSRP